MGRNEDANREQLPYMTCGNKHEIFHTLSEVGQTLSRLISATLLTSLEIINIDTVVP